MARKALPPTPEQKAAREEHRAEGRHAAPAYHPEHAAEGAVRRWFHIVGSKTIFGHAPGTRAELELTDGQANVLMNAGHIVPVDASEPAAAPAVVTEPEVTDTTSEDNEAANEAE